MDLQCSVMCGNGIRMREVLCRSQQGGEVIHMDYCNLRPHKPSDSQACYNAPCPGRLVSTITALLAVLCFFTNQMCAACLADPIVIFALSVCLLVHLSQPTVHAQ